MISVCMCIGFWVLGHHTIEDPGVASYLYESIMLFGGLAIRIVRNNAAVGMWGIRVFDCEASRYLDMGLEC